MKILVLRFSSIGDIVLTTPVLRGLNEHLDDSEIHYLTKKKFATLLENNPRIHKLWTIENSIDEVLSDLKKQNFDLIVDLHKNVRTLALKRKLGVKAVSFNKLNIEKWMLVNLKHDRMPDIHIVERYMETVDFLGLTTDGLPCELYIADKNKVDLATFSLSPKGFLGVAIGAQFATKTLPVEQLITVLANIDQPIVLLGGPEDAEKAAVIIYGLSGKNIQNLCGKLNLQQSASVVAQAAVLLTHDTGLMHIASCFHVPIVSVWGNTVPQLGMYPYYPKNPELFSLHEVKNLNCRPCSKIGFQACPKKHFKCMTEQDLEGIINKINGFFYTY